MLRIFSYRSPIIPPRIDVSIFRQLTHRLLGYTLSWLAHKLLIFLSNVQLLNIKLKYMRVLTLYFESRISPLREFSKMSSTAPSKIIDVNENFRLSLIRAKHTSLYVNRAFRLNKHKEIAKYPQRSDENQFSNCSRL